MPAHDFHLERVATPTGRMLLVTDDADQLRALDWEDHEERMLRLMRLHYRGSEIRLRESVAASAAARALEAYFAGDREILGTLPVATGGTEFQRSVWRGLRGIAYGEAISYRALAIRIGRPNAMRAVGLANGANPIAVVVPCHRVIGADGSLTGFGGGIARKRWLLEFEGVKLAPENLLAA